MKLRFFAPCIAVLLPVLSAAACTMKKQEAPEFTGPSEFGTSITASVDPDVLKQDGASSSRITITARGPNGEPLANKRIRAEITVNGVSTDFGKLSSATVDTGSNGAATIIYTAPLGAQFVTEESTMVRIALIPAEGDFSNAAARYVTLRLIATGIVVPPTSGLVAAFTFSPDEPTDHQTVFFDASSSQAPANNPIVSYSWNFGDGETGSGRTASHSYDAPGSYVVTLTVADQAGRTAQTTESLQVAALVLPTAVIDVSPTDPAPNTQVNFNGVRSTAAPGRRIEKYQWDLGDGSGGLKTGQRVSHTYTREGTYTVTLVVTDDLGQKGSVSTSVTVEEPEALTRQR
jgi:PKD repeat protein